MVSILDYNERINMLNRIYDDLKRVGLVKNKSQFATECLQRSNSYCFKWGEKRCPSNLTFMHIWLYLLSLKRTNEIPPSEKNLFDDYIQSTFDVLKA